MKIVLHPEQAPCSAETIPLDTEELGRRLREWAQLAAGKTRVGEHP